MDKKLYINVFGKDGCVKCATLKRRLEEMLKDSKYSAFEMIYWDVMTEEGLVKFCLSECLNPSRIPAMIVSQVGADGKMQYMPNPNPGAEDAVCRKSRLYTYQGIQTDYSEEGKGIITPAMLKSVLDEALAIG